MNLVDNPDFSGDLVDVDGLALPSRWAGRYITDAVVTDGVLAVQWDYVDDWSVPLVVSNAVRVDSVFRNDTPAQAGMPYRATVKVGSDAPTVKVMLRVGTDVLGQETVTPGSSTAADTLVEITGTAPTNYVPTGSNGLHLAIEAEGSILLTEPEIVADAPTTVTVTDPGPQTATLAAPYVLDLVGTTTADDPALSWSVAGLPDGLALDGARIEGTPTTVGQAMAVVTATDVTGQSGSVAVEFTVTDTPPDEDDALVDVLAARVAAYVGKAGSAPVIARAKGQVPVVVEFVRGYTRGRGFTGGVPAAALQAVVVSACSRLATNPEQVSYYVTADYTERPALLAGWTLPEIAVLHRYRRVTS